MSPEWQNGESLHEGFYLLLFYAHTLKGGKIIERLHSKNVIFFLKRKVTFICTRWTRLFISKRSPNRAGVHEHRPTPTCSEIPPPSPLILGFCLKSAPGFPGTSVPEEKALPSTGGHGLRSSLSALLLEPHGLGGILGQEDPQFLSL